MGYRRIPHHEGSGDIGEARGVVEITDLVEGLIDVDALVPCLEMIEDRFAQCTIGAENKHGERPRLLTDQGEAPNDGAAGQAAYGLGALLLIRIFLHEESLELLKLCDLTDQELRFRDIFEIMVEWGLDALPFFAAMAFRCCALGRPHWDAPPRHDHGQGRIGQFILEIPQIDFLFTDDFQILGEAVVERGRLKSRSGFRRGEEGRVVEWRGDLLKFIGTTPAPEAGAHTALDDGSRTSCTPELAQPVGCDRPIRG